MKSGKKKGTERRVLLISTDHVKREKDKAEVRHDIKEGGEERRDEQEQEEIVLEGQPS